RRRRRRPDRPARRRAPPGRLQGLHRLRRARRPPPPDHLGAGRRRWAGAALRAPSARHAPPSPTRGPARPAGFRQSDGGWGGRGPRCLPRGAGPAGGGPAGAGGGGPVPLRAALAGPAPEGTGGRVVEQGRARLASHRGRVAGEPEAQRLLAALDAVPFAPPAPAEVGGSPEIVRGLLREGLLLDLDGTIFTAAAVEKARLVVREGLERHGS